MSSSELGCVCSWCRIRHTWKHCSWKDVADVKASSYCGHSTISARVTAKSSRSVRGRLSISTNENSKRRHQKKVPCDAPRNKSTSGDKSKDYNKFKCINPGVVGVPGQTGWTAGTVCDRSSKMATSACGDREDKADDPCPTAIPSIEKSGIINSPTA
jgi:hypothetical protein